MQLIYKIIYSTNILKRNDHHFLTWILLWKVTKGHIQVKSQVLAQGLCCGVLHGATMTDSVFPHKLLAEAGCGRQDRRLCRAHELLGYVSAACRVFSCLHSIQLLEFSYNPSFLEFGPSQHWKHQVGVGFTKTNWQSLPKNVIQRLSYGQDTPVMQVKLK